MASHSVEGGTGLKDVVGGGGRQGAGGGGGEDLSRTGVCSGQGFFFMGLGEEQTVSCSQSKDNDFSGSALLVDAVLICPCV